MSSLVPRIVGRRDFLRSATLVLGTVTTSLPACSHAVESVATGSRAAERARASAAPVKLGMLLPADDAEEGTGARLQGGLDLALAETDHRIAGRPLSVIAADAGASVEVGVGEIRRLVQQVGIDVLVGAGGPALARAIRDLPDEAATIVVLAHAPATLPGWAKQDRYVFRTAPTPWQQNYPFGDWLARNVARRLFVCGLDTPAARAAAASLQEGFAAQGATIVGSWFAPPGTLDFEPYLRRLAAAAPEATWCHFAGDTAVQFLRQYAAQGLTREYRLTGPGCLAAEHLLPALGDAARGAITGHSWLPALDTPENREFQRAYGGRYGLLPDDVALDGYDAGRAIVAALQRTGGDAADRAALAHALTAVSFASPRGPFRFDPATRQAVGTLYVREVKDQHGVLANVLLDTIGEVYDAGDARDST